MGFNSFLYQTTKSMESFFDGGLISHGNEAVPFKTAVTDIAGPVNKNKQKSSFRVKLSLLTYTLYC